MKLKLLSLSIFGIFLLLLAVVTTAHALTNKDEAKTKVGNPKSSGTCWPTTGYISQGPQGQTSHSSLLAGSGGYAIDIANPLGTPVIASFDGTADVYNCTGGGACDNGYGNLVKIIPDVSPDTRVYYAHLSEIQVRDKAKVLAGDQLGLSGETGSAQGNHLHYEFRGGSLRMTTPYIPQDLASLSCDENCVPRNISSSTCEGATAPTTQDLYWLLLHRQSNTEELLKGVPGNKSKSTVIKAFSVKTGKPGERPTPLPSLVGKDYWTIEWKRPQAGDLGPYFMKLNIPYTSLTPFGPEPYTECGGQQCNWKTPGDFGLHGTGGNSEKVNNDGSQDWHWSSGCIRHLDEDITYLYNTVDPRAQELRYYVENN